jgi:hypothetical protein
LRQVARRRHEKRFDDVPRVDRSRGADEAIPSLGGRATGAGAALMTTTPSPTPTRALSAKTFGVLALAGLVIAFSLSSTLVKRAESPGVLVAFWRMVAVSLVWKVLLLSTGRHVTLANVRQALVPGVFFGLNLAVFFAGATHDSVADAALIGSLARF